MGRKAMRPVIRIEPVFTGERTITDAFGEAYARYFSSLNQPSDTFASGEFAHYNAGESGEKEAEHHEQHTGT